MFGGGGFIGRHLTATLAAAGHMPVVVERDWRDRLRGAPAAVVNLAATIGEPGGIAAAANDMRAANEAVRVARKFRCPLFHASSIAAAAPGSSAYAFRKYAVERELLADPDLLSPAVPFTVARFQNVWATDQTAGLTGEIVAASNAGRPVRLNGDGHAVREWLHADDVAQRIVAWVGGDYQYRRQVWRGVPATVLEHVDTVRRLAQLPDTGVEFVGGDEGVRTPPVSSPAWQNVSAPDGR